MGAPLSPVRREALLAYARRHDALIIEDDYGGEFRFDGAPVPTLRSQDRDGRVIYVGTFSQSLLPALRIGFIIAPERARAALLAARERSDWHGPAIEHATLAAFIAEGHLARYVRKMRRIYAERRAALLKALSEHGATLLDPIPAPAGLHVTCLLRRPVPTRAVIDQAAKLGVAVDGLDIFAAERPAQPGLVLGFGRVEAARMDEAVRRLAQAVREVA